MLETIINKFFHLEYSPEKKSYYLGCGASLFLYGIMTFMSVLTKSGYMIVMYLFLMLILNMVIIYFGDQTGKYTMCSFLIAILLNVLTIPILYIFGGHLISGVFAYFIVGMLYCTVALDGIVMIWTIFITLFVTILSMAYVFIHTDPLLYRENTSPSHVVETIIGVIISGIVSGICIKLRVKFLSQETDKAIEARREVVAANEAKNVFLSNISHEIRTPMNAILGTSQILLTSDITDNARDKVLNILNACKALLSTINDLLDFSRVESGKIEIEEEDYNLQDIIADIVNMISIRVMDKPIEFFVNVDPEIPTILHGDGKRIRQIFINILNNAVKYTEEGHIILTVGREEYEDGFILLTASVKDTGVGIKDDDKQNLFGEFSRVDTKETNLGNVEGTGLGLSICRDMLSAMNGDIAFDSVYGEGTEFRFRVPQGLVDSEDGRKKIKINDASKYRVLVFEKDELSDSLLLKTLEQCGIEADSAIGGVMFRASFIAHEYTHVIVDRNNYRDLEGFLKSHLGNTKLIVVADINQSNVDGYPGSILIRPAYCGNVAAIFNGEDHSSIHRMTVNGSFKCPNARIMAVDDNLTNLQVVESILSKYDMQVFTASGGRECLYKMESQEVDMVFLDYMMPEMDGVDTLKAIRNMDAKWAKTVPIIALTANAVGGVKEMLLSEGFDEYISKPIEIDKLEKCILSFLPDELVKPADMGE